MNRKVKLKYVFAVVMVFAAVVRLATLVLGWDSLAEDPDSYTRLAENLANSGTFGIETEAGVAPRAYRPPLYPWLLSWFVSGSGVSRIAVVVLHLVLGLATVGLSYAIASRLGLEWPWLPAAAVACDPLLLRQSQFVMTETLAAFLVCVVWWSWIRCEISGPSSGSQRFLQPYCFLGVGLLFGLAVLCRPTAAPWAVLCMLALQVRGSVSFSGQIQRTGLFVLGILLCIGPWTWRNARQLGSPVWATTHGGYTLLLANNPLIYEHFRKNGPTRDWDAEPFHAAWARRAGADEFPADESPRDKAYWFADTLPTSFSQPLPELEDDRLAYASAWATIGREPWMFASSCLYRVCWFWAPWPNTGSWLAKGIIGTWYGVAFLAFIVSLIRLIRDRCLMKWIVPLALVISLTAVHALYWSNMRMRGPLMCAVYVIGACGIPRNYVSVEDQHSGGGLVL